MAAGLGLISAVSARADSIALTFSGTPFDGSGFVQSGAGAGTIGWEFTTANTITVTSLGFWGDGLGSAAGLTSSHQVGIWDTGGTLLLSATVAAGTGEPLLNGFRFDSTLAGTTTLSPGMCIIGASVTGTGNPSDLYGFSIPLANLTMSPGLAYIQTQGSGTNTSFSFPGTALPAVYNAGTFGPDFTIAAADTPEPATTLSFGAGALLLIAAGIRRHRIVQRQIGGERTCRAGFNPCGQSCSSPASAFEAPLLSGLAVNYFDTSPEKAPFPLNNIHKIRPNSPNSA